MRDPTSMKSGHTGGLTATGRTNLLIRLGGPGPEKELRPGSDSGQYTTPTHGAP